MMEQEGIIPMWVLEAAFAMLDADCAPFGEDNETSDDDRLARELTAPNSLVSH